MPDAADLPLPAGQTPAPLPLPERSAEDFAARSKLCGHAIPLDRPAAAFCAPPPKTDAPWITAALGGAPLALQVSWGHLRRLTDAPLEALSDADAALLLEDRIAPQLEALEAKTGLALRLRSIAQDAPDLDFAIGLGIANDRFRLLASNAALGALQSHLPPLATVLPATLPLALRLEIAAVTIAAADLRSLTPGDAFELKMPGAEVRLVVQDAHGAPGKWTEQGLELTGPLTRINHGEHLGMASETLEPAAAQLDDLDVRISIRAGEALMTLGDLKALGPGSILPLAKPQDDGVDLVVNGQRIGRGQLVTVGGTRAVEILDLFEDG